MMFITPFPLTMKGPQMQGFLCVKNNCLYFYVLKIVASLLYL